MEDFNNEGVVTSDGAKVNVRETPGKAGKVVGQIHDGATVKVSKRTVMKETIGGETAEWYKITTSGENSVEGWVFGASLSFK